MIKSGLYTDLMFALRNFNINFSTGEYKYREYGFSFYDQFFYYGLFDVKFL